jgi:hypothetical protein
MAACAVLIEEPLRVGGGRGLRGERPRNENEREEESSGELHDRIRSSLMEPMVTYM